MSKLIDGDIRRGSECSYKKICPIAESNSCRHKGISHPCDYSCAMVKYFKATKKHKSCNT